MENTNDKDPTPKLKSSPKYCKECLFKFIEDTTTDDDATYLDVHIRKDNARYIEHEIDSCTGNIQKWCKDCSNISYFKQVVSPLSFPKYNKAIEKLIIKCPTCGEPVYHSDTSYIDYLISFGWVESFLTRKPILILYLPWWDAKDKCIVCKQVLELFSNCQKSCLHCYTTYIGCRYCLTTNIIFGITDKSQCKKCKRIITINVINIPNIGSGNYEIDEFLYHTRFNYNNYNAIANYIDYHNKNQVWFYDFIEKKLVNNVQPIIEWIPYSQIKDFKKVARGGFGIVYKATWLQNYNGDIDEHERFKNIFNSDSDNSFESSSLLNVAVKRFFSQNIKTILNELKSLFRCYDENLVIKYYGITQDPESKDFMLVMEYANGKNLHKYVRENFEDITWNDKINILWKISEGLITIHEKNFIHRDFHSGNIFLSETDSYQRWQIGDLGLTQHSNDIFLNDELYGIISYTAPEILNCDKYSRESDIYSMGMIMWELTTGRKPFDNLKHDITESELMLFIIDGKRPEITNDTPECFSNLMKRCWDSNPIKRPSAIEIYETYYFWLFREEYVKQFNEAEEKRLELIELKILGPEFTVSSLTYTNLSTNTLNNRPNNRFNSIERSNNGGYISKDVDFDIESCSISKNTTDMITCRSLVPHSNDTNNENKHTNNTNNVNNGDPTPKLKSSPVPILFVPFNNKKNECSNCGNEYSKSPLFEQKYCKNCLSYYINQIENIHAYMVVHMSNNNTRCISDILYFKQIVTPFLTPKYIEEKIEEKCELCGNLVYQEICNINDRFCSGCYLISSEWVDSSLTKKPIPILYLPWWDVSYDCITCGRHLEFISDHQKWCSTCFMIYIGCRYCLTTNIVFGVIDKLQCKKCKRIIFIAIDIANTTSGNYDMDVLLGLNTKNYYMVVNYNNYIDNIGNGFNSLQVYEFIKERFSDRYNPIIKWFPYSQIVDVDYMTKGGFSIIFKASSVKYGTIALKSLDDKYFLNELKSHSQCWSRFDVIVKLYGFTRHLGNYILVMEYADGGDLRNYLRKNFVNITWMEKLMILQNITEGLHAIHKKNFIHRDFHSCNILLKYEGSRNLWKIGDFGLSQHTDDTTLLDDGIYGILPYIAPEIFRRTIFSKASDIYSMGMIMWELTTGRIPFDEVYHDHNLVIEVILGKRPKVTEDTPIFFSNLMESCWNSNPLKRPPISEILESVSWYKYGYTTLFEEQFMQAEERRSELINLRNEPHSLLDYSSRQLRSFISKNSLEFSIDSFNREQGYYSDCEDCAI
ncbi:hypothetical protein RclHR1_11600005 [Rhizophagus clarus]|uniref:Protein kinase domain-containing protein n=1 Tax=Rhizophagus clarus TaxID=94130 RepID=A0A2Z6Q4W6_9GLOM|nr:hypothetical protein RclHR1_11600005 [Rhizophagus clarus]